MHTIRSAVPHTLDGSIQTQATVAQEAIARFHAAKLSLVDAVRAETRLLDEKPSEKLAAILRMMQLPDPRAKDAVPPKTLAATEAEKYVELDDGYRAYLLNLRNGIHCRMRAEAECEVARLNAELQVATLKVLSGVGV